MFDKTNTILFCSYNIITSLFNQFGLTTKYERSKVFHFLRSHGNFNPSLLSLSPLRGPILWPKDIWRYLSFIFNRKLSFYQHISFYFNKALSTIVRHGSHQGESPQNGLGDEWTCGTTLASAYVLCHLSAAWSQLQMKERESEGKWVLIGVSPLNTGGRVQ